MTPSDEKALALADAIRAASRATIAATRTAQGLPALPEAQVAVLRALRDASPLTPAQLAERLALARPTVSNLLRDLESAGMITRSPAATDGRSVVIDLTDRARAIQDAFQQGRAHVVDAAWLALDARDRRVLAAAAPSIRRWAERLQEAEAPTSRDRP